MPSREKWGQGTQIPRLTLHVREEAPDWRQRDGVGTPGRARPGPGNPQTPFPGVGAGWVPGRKVGGPGEQRRGKGRVSLPCAPFRPPLRKAVGCWWGGQLCEEGRPFRGCTVSLLCAQGHPTLSRELVCGPLGPWLCRAPPSALASGCSSGWLLCQLSPTPALGSGGPGVAPWVERGWQTPQCMLGSHPLRRDRSGGLLPTQWCPGTGPEWVGKPRRRGGRRLGGRPGARRALLRPSAHSWGSVGARPSSAGVSRASGGWSGRCWASPGRGPQWSCWRAADSAGPVGGTVGAASWPGGRVQVYLKLQPLAPVRQRRAPCPGRARPRAHGCPCDVAPACPVPSGLRPFPLPPTPAAASAPEGTWGPGLWGLRPCWGRPCPARWQADWPRPRVQSHPERGPLSGTEQTRGLGQHRTASSVGFKIRRTSPVIK